MPLTEKDHAGEPPLFPIGSPLKAFVSDDLRTMVARGPAGGAGPAKNCRCAAKLQVVQV